MAIKDMTVKRLAAILKTLPQNALIVTSSDSEGNSYSKLTDMCMAGICKVTEEGHYMEVHSDDDFPKGAVDALVLYPD